MPTEVLIGPYRWSVGVDGEAAYDYSYLGVCLNRSKRIKLDPRQSDTEIPQTFIHEVLHAIGFAYEIEALDRHTLNDQRVITDKIDLMASGWLQFLRANPGVVRWLMEPH
jgi:hypothetical protein